MPASRNSLKLSASFRSFTTASATEVISAIDLYDDLADLTRGPSLVLISALLKN
jgi:hypothetical protein